MGYVKGLKCRECGREYPVDPIYVCEFCFGPLEVIYDYKKIKKTLKRKTIEKRDGNLWRDANLHDQPADLFFRCSIVLGLQDQ